MESKTIFFSYSRTDSDFVLKLAQDLREAGAEIWLDQLDIKPGSRWDASVERALKESPRLIVILSPESVGSNNVMDEVSFALESKKTVFPVLMSPCETPFRLRRVQRIDFTKDYQTALKKLLNVLGYGSVSKPEVPEVKPDPKPTPNNESENSLWEEAKNTNTVASYEKYLKEYPEGIHKDSALAAINDIQETDKKKPPVNPNPEKKGKNKKLIPIIGGFLFVVIVVIVVFVYNQNEKRKELVALENKQRIQDSIQAEETKRDSLLAIENLRAEAYALMLDSIVIGNNFRGGIIFEIDTTGEHGKMITDVDLNNGKAIDWAGAKNICSEHPSKSPKYKWDLPTLDELKKIDRLNKIRSDSVQINKRRYWSSTPEGALMQGYDFTQRHTFAFQHGKTRTNYVRAVREF